MNGAGLWAEGYIQYMNITGNVFKNNKVLFFASLWPLSNPADL
jgi:hypothetical protein